MIGEALQILLIGMVTVLFFLVVLVFVTIAVGKIVTSIEAKMPKAELASGDDSAMIAAAIAIAMSK